MNLDAVSGQDLTGAFKITNLAVAFLAVLSGVSQMFNGM
ncbi:uncharacterized protein PRCAT00000790001 [Priceomyces carsonii]|nr:unnamed protein product [Priceomyces carsonii]